METKLKTNKTGFGMLESLVAIAVFGVTLVMGLSLIVKSLSVIKDNQISDQATSFMVGSLEFIKSPNVQNDITGDPIAEGFYSVNYSGGSFTSVTDRPTGLGDSCEKTSPYYVSIDEEFDSILFCNQLQVSPVDPLDDDSDFFITSKAVYKLTSEDFVVREIRGFKLRNL